MIPMKRVVTLVAASGLALTIAGAATATAGASVRSHPMANAKLTRVIPGGPMVRTSGKEAARSTDGVPTVALSENWSGYAVSSNKAKFSYVHSEFVQPKIKCPGVANQWTSNWVGLDGFSDQTVEQDGTFAFCSGAKHNKPVYVAWYEMFPAGSVAVFTVKPGDIIEASVRYVSTTKMFDLTISDVTSGKTSGTSAGCSACMRDSAEWIIERPALCNSSFTKCFLTALANFGTATMTDDTAKAAGPAVSIGKIHNVVPILMVQPLKSGSLLTLDQTGPIVRPIDGFTETWTSSGKTLPITLSTKH
jgi:hypothetical protein